LESVVAPKRTTETTGRKRLTRLSQSPEVSLLTVSRFTESFYRFGSQERTLLEQSFVRIVRAFGAAYLTGLLTPEYLGAEL
jgi:hypothetical protein